MTGGHVFGQDKHLHQAYGVTGMAVCAAILYFGSPVWWLAAPLWLGFAISLMYYFLVGHALFGPYLFLFGYLELMLALFRPRR
ncbi:MAG: hypothetical protein AB7K24_09780 [Gemmataceae bacterium]